MLATEYICIDEQLPIERFTDDDIIATVQNDEEDEEGKEKSNKEYEPQPMISLKTALTSVDNLMRFVNDPPSTSGFVFNKKALPVLRSLKSEISRYQTDKLSQSQIDNFINGT